MFAVSSLFGCQGASDAAHPVGSPLFIAAATPFFISAAQPFVKAYPQKTSPDLVETLSRRLGQTDENRKPRISGCGGRTELLGIVAGPFGSERPIPLCIYVQISRSEGRVKGLSRDFSTFAKASRPNIEEAAT